MVEGEARWVAVAVVVVVVMVVEGARVAENAQRSSGKSGKSGNRASTISCDFYTGVKGTLFFHSDNAAP